MRKVYRIEGKRLIEVSKDVESYAVVLDGNTSYVSSQIMSVLRLAVEESVKAVGEEGLLVIETLNEQGIVIAAGKHFFSKREAQDFASCHDRCYIMDARGDNDNLPTRQGKVLNPCPRIESRTEC